MHWPIVRPTRATWDPLARMPPIDAKWLAPAVHSTAEECILPHVLVDHSLEASTAMAATEHVVMLGDAGPIAAREQPAQCLLDLQ